MVRLIALLCTLLVVNSARAEGFFRPWERERPPLPELPAPQAKATAACGISARYNTPHANWLEVRYVGAAADCFSGWEAVASAAYAGVPAADLAEVDRLQGLAAAGDTQWRQGYQCAVLVTFDAAASASVTIDYTGAAECQSPGVRSIALWALRNAARCYVFGGGCVFWGPAGPLGRV
jgi:hypothetical protein